jgi:hypothetical protein
MKRFLLSLAVVAGCGLATARAAVVDWTINSAQSYIRLNIPDQDIPIDETNLLPLGLRDYVNGTTIAPSWTDAGGKRSFVGGTIKTDYVEGTSLQFIAGQQDVNALEGGSFRPDPAAWNGSSYNANTGAAAAFGANVILGPGTGSDIVAGDIALRNIDYDLLGSVLLAPGGGGWTTASVYNVGLKAGAFADLDSILGLYLREETLGDAFDAPNTLGSLTITNLGGNQRRLTLVISVPLEITVDPVVLDANITGVIVADATVAAPAPQLVNARPLHNAFGGSDKVDTGVSLIQRNAAPQVAQLSNIISSTQGINGVVLDFDNLAALGDITLEYKMSPQNVFATPVASWADVPPAPTATLLPDAGQAGSDRVRLTWPNGTITDRYLCIRVIVGGNTIAELYLGHLRGEMTGASGSKFTVLVGDILAVRTDLTQAKTASGRTDVDKSGTVLVQDILDTRSNLAKELSQVTIPANP